MFRALMQDAAVEPTDPPSLPDVEEAVPEDVQDSALENIEALGPIFGVAVNMLIGALSGLALTLVVTLIVRFVLRPRPRLLSHLKILVVPAAVAISFLGARVGLMLSGQDLQFYNVIAFALLICTAAGFAWLALRVVKVIEMRVALRYESVTVADRRGRRIKTQMQLIKRILNTLIIILAISAVLLSLPQVRALGAGLLASAGLVSVIAALAVQSTLTNVFAGVQLAFTDAIRVGDVVVMDEYYGTIEDITMSYVVLKIWDGRRIIYPSSYFTTTSFENYTRVGTEISAGIDFHVDWRVPVDALRARLRALLESSPLWDGRDSSIQVLDIANDRATLRVAVSARNAGDLWDLQCLVREDFIKFVSEDHPEAMNIMRLEHAPVETTGDDAEQPAAEQPDTQDAKIPAPVVPGPKKSGGTSSEPPVERSAIPTVPQKDAEQSVDTGSVPLTQYSDTDSMYTGSIAAIQRGADMAGPGEDAYRERSGRTGEIDLTEEQEVQQEAAKPEDDPKFGKNAQAKDD